MSHDFPYFPFYPKDFSTDGKVEAMRTESVGAYILLLCKAWRENPPGTIPNDDQILSRWARVDSVRWAELKPEVMAAFTLGKDNRWQQKRLRQEFDNAIASTQKKTDVGRASANARWNKHLKKDVMQTQCDRIANALPTHCDRNATQTQIHTQTQTNPNSNSDPPPTPRPGEEAKKRKRTKSDEPPDPRVRLVTDAWKAEFLTAVGYEYAFGLGDGSAAKKLLSLGLGEDPIPELRRRMELFLTDPDFYIVKNRTLPVFAVKVNAYGGQRARTTADAKRTQQAQREFAEILPRIPTE